MQKTLHKGQEIVLEGRLVNQNYETKNGEKRFVTFVEVNEFLVLKAANEKTLEKTTQKTNNK